MTRDAWDRLDEISGSDPTLALAWEELRNCALTDATRLALESAAVPNSVLDEFLRLAVRCVPPVTNITTNLEGRTSQLFALALTTINLIAVRSVGHEALQYCLQPGNLSSSQLAVALSRLNRDAPPDAVVWFHRRLIELRVDGAYYWFLKQHFEVIQMRSWDEMANYLLVPDRGPDVLNLESLELVVRQGRDPEPFRRRMLEWLHRGLLDGEGPSAVPASFLYLSAPYRPSPIVDEIHRRVGELVRATDQRHQRIGLRHLASMIERKYDRVDEVVRLLDPWGSPALAPPESRMYRLLRSALVALARSDDSVDHTLLVEQIRALDRTEGGLLGMYRHTAN